jgi:hypothetical protein
MLQQRARAHKLRGKTVTESPAISQQDINPDHASTSEDKVSDDVLGAADGQLLGSGLLYEYLKQGRARIMES